MSQARRGALQGALAGATTGASVGGVPGAIIGGIGGLILGGATGSIADSDLERAERKQKEAQQGLLSGYQQLYGPMLNREPLSFQYFAGGGVVREDNGRRDGDMVSSNSAGAQAERDAQAKSWNAQQSAEAAQRQAQVAESQRAAQQSAVQARDWGADSRGQQQQLVDALRAQAEGRGGPSLAQMQLQQTLGQNQAMAAGQMASQRGVAPGLGAYLVGRNSAGMAQQAAGQGAQLRAQEQLAAQSALAQQLASQRGQDVGAYQAQAGALQAQNALAVQAEAERQRNQTFIYGQMIEASQKDADRASALQQYNYNSATQGQANMFNALGQTAAWGVGQYKANSGAPAAEQTYSTAPVPMASGGIVDDPANDTVPAMLSPGEIVLPRSVAEDEDAPDKSKAFVEALKKHKAGKGKGGEASPKAMLEELGAIQAKLSAIAAQLGG